MSTYLYELPTTGAISFNDFCLDKSHSYAAEIAGATQARQNLRAALKESKRAEGERDFLRLVKVVDDYLPHLFAIKACFDADEVALNQEPVFSWRSTLSSNLFNTSPRQSLTSLHADLAFSLLTYAFTLSNLARSTVAALGAYEYERHMSDKVRKEKDEKLNFGVNLLCRASGVFAYVGEVVREWDRSEGSASQSGRPPDVSLEMVNALSKMALADAQTLAMRKLLSKSAYESTLSPGPPLPSSHPSPALLAKLHLECASLYTSARALASAKDKSSPLSLSKSKDTEGASGVNPALRHYLADNGNLHAALAHKWLGVDAGENGGAQKAGFAVAFLAWSKSSLESLLSSSSSDHSLPSLPSADKLKSQEKKDLRNRFKEEVKKELEDVKTFYKYYKKMNDSLHFEKVPSQGEVANMVPEGRAAVTVKAYVPPVPKFGPGSVEHVRRKAEEARIAEDGESKDVDGERQGTYAGAGSYF